MPRIVVCDANAELIKQAGWMEVVDRNGDLIGFVSTELVEDVKIALERLRRPTKKWLTTAEVLAHLEALEQSEGRSSAGLVT